MAITPYNIDRTTGVSYKPVNRPGAGEQAFRDRRAGAAGVQAFNQMAQNPDFNVGNQLFQTIPPASYTTSSGGGSGRSYGGGGGGGGGGYGGAPAVDPKISAAYKALYNSMNADTSVDDSWNAYITSMRGVYDPAKAAAKWDTAGGAIGDAGTQGRGRMSGIYNELLARASTGRRDVQGAVSQGDQALQDIQARFGAASNQGAGSINNVLSNFDAGQMNPGVYQNELQNMFAAGQIGNQRMGNAYDAAFADRPQVYAGLNSDVMSGMTAQEQAMMQQVAAKRAAELQGNEAQLAQVLGTAGISRAQANQQRTAELAKLQAELAGMGITI